MGGQEGVEQKLSQRVALVTHSLKEFLTFTQRRVREGEKSGEGEKRGRGGLLHHSKPL